MTKEGDSDEHELVAARVGGGSARPNKAGDGAKVTGTRENERIGGRDATAAGL